MTSLIVSGLVPSTPTDPTLYAITSENRDINLDAKDTLHDVYRLMQMKPLLKGIPVKEAAPISVLNAMYELVTDPSGAQEYVSATALQRQALFPPDQGIEEPYLKSILKACDVVALNSIATNQKLDSIIELMSSSSSAGILTYLQTQMQPTLEQVAQNTADTVNNLLVKVPHAYHHSSAENTYVALDQHVMTLGQALLRAMFNPVQTYTDAVHTDYSFIPYLQTLALTRPTASGSIAKMPSTNISNMYTKADLLMNNSIMEPIWNKLSDPGVPKIFDGASNDAVYYRSKDI